MNKDTIDYKILEYLNFDDGFFIECGANDGISQSNTYKLENDKNWRGILIEPSPTSYSSCVKNRSGDNIILNCALVSDDYSFDTIRGDFDGNLMSSVYGVRRNNSRLIEVKASTLTSILDGCDIDVIDFFSLDVEGYELEILKGLDFRKYKPIYILIEVYEKDKQKINEFMLSKNYELICNLSGFNHSDNPHWDGTHNDYLYKLKNINDE